jgi:hypothetical protein
MSHPKDRRDRFLIGMHHGIRRANGWFRFETNREYRKELVEIWSKRLRHMTKACSCSMCGNPRRKEFRTNVRLTMQELKLEDINTLLFDNTGV